MSGYIYVMDRGDARKIGFSSRPEVRAFEVAASLLTPVNLIHSVYVDAPRDSERAAHYRLKKCRLDGEWFDVSIDEAIDAVEWAAANPMPMNDSLPISFKFTPEEKDMLDRLAESHGGRKAAIIAGLEALERKNGISKAQVIAAIEENWSDR